MRKVLSGIVALFCVVLLTSCHGLPFLPSGTSDREKADARMEQIAAAVNAHDAAALKALFSTNALEKATDIDERLDYFLSFFPNGILSWVSDSLWADGRDLLKVPYKVSAGGRDYWLAFADFPESEIGPDNVGLYALGVSPWAEDSNSGDAGPLFSWVYSVTPDGHDEEGRSGVYFPPTISELSAQKLNVILNVLNDEDKDASWLRSLFSNHAQLEHLAQIDDELEELYALFPQHDVLWQADPQIEPILRENTENGEKRSLLLATFRVSSAGVDYWLSFAYITENTVNPKEAGLYALGVAPRTASGDSPAEEALFAWADSFDVEATVPPGIFISQ